jgi:hypothetical protein
LNKKQEESRKSLGLTHRTLLALLTAVLLFALSPNRYQTYEQTYALLDHLESIDGDEYSNWAQTTANQKLVSQHDFLCELGEDVVEQGGPTIE